MDLFKLRREGPPAATPVNSLEELLSTPTPADPLPSPEPAVFSTPVVSEPTPIKAQVAMRSESVITEGFHFNGVVKALTDLRVDGTLDGDIEVKSLVIGGTGAVSGQCRCDVLMIEGRFQGKAECRELHLNAGAVIDGEVTYSVLRAQRGAQITGKYIQKRRDAT